MRKIHQALYALALSAAVFGCSATPTRESTGEYIDDAAVTARIKSEFVKDELVSALDIKVETFKGHVQLSGFADSPSAIPRAASIARAVPGVRAVDNDIRLKSQ